RVGEFPGQLVGGFPSCAVPRHDEVWLEGFECSDGWGNDRFKEAACEMQATEQSVDRLNPCEGLCVSQGIDRARMPSARQHHQALVTHMDHEGLIVMDERVGLPGAVDFCIV